VTWNEEIQLVSGRAITLLLKALHCLLWGPTRWEGEEPSVDQTNTCESCRNIIAIYECEYSAEKPVETVFKTVSNYKVTYVR
jgi:hypothetical protein